MKSKTIILEEREQKHDGLMVYVLSKKEATLSVWIDYDEAYAEVIRLDSLGESNVVVSHRALNQEVISFNMMQRIRVQDQADERQRQRNEIQQGEQHRQWGRERRLEQEQADLEQDQDEQLETDIILEEIADQNEQDRQQAYEEIITALAEELTDES